MVARGDIVVANPIAVAPPVGMPDGAVVTQLPSPGSPIVDGGVIYEANDRPVFALADPIPLYRDLAIGDTGDDVRRLQESLSRLGLLRGPADGNYSRATASAVEQLYRTRGYDPPPPPDEEVRGLVQQRDQFDTSGDPDVLAGLADLERQIEAARARVGVPTRRAEFFSIPSLPTTVISVGRTVGQLVAGDAPVMTVSSGSVTVEIPFLDPGFDRFVGKAVELYADPGSADAIDATATAAGARQDGTSVLLVPAPQLTSAHVGQNIRVVIVDHSTAESTLLVPFTAIVSGEDGRAQVERRAAGGTLTRVDVVIIDESAGEIALRAVNPDALHEGDRVRIAPQ